MFDSSTDYNNGLSTNNTVSQQYLQFQSQLAVQQALVQAQQLGAQAAQVQNQIAQSALNTAQTRVAALSSAQSAVSYQQEYIKNQYQANQYQQDALNGQYGVMMTNLQQLRKNLVVDQETFTKLEYSQVGGQMAAAAGSGVQANTGSQSDLARFIVNETNRSASNSETRTMNDINNVANQAMSIQIQKAFGNWNLDTQVKFSNESLIQGINNG